MSTRIDDWPAQSGATFSGDRKYRYTLTRAFKFYPDDSPIPTSWVVFIMLNPSTADEHVADPTVRRCMTYARDWGYSGLCVLNIFALRSTDPKALYTVDDPIGTMNDAAIRGCLELYKPMVVCAWGEHGALHNRGQDVLDMVRAAGLTPHYLKLNASGQPAHPLYLPGVLTPKPYVL